MAEWVTDDNAALLTDLYELTMAASYFAHDLVEPATFDLFARSLPPERSFLVSCGLAQALDLLERWHFPSTTLAYLESLALFDRAFLDHLAGLRFTGEVWAIPEGEVFFAGEPLVRITAPLIEAQLVETFLLNAVGFQTMIASKAARVAIACAGHAFVDFSPRRDHGADAALKAARAAYVGGAAATSNTLAGMLYGIPVAGTMAHSYVMRFASEIEAFRCFAGDFPRSSTLLIDTYDTLDGARHAAVVGHDLAARGQVLEAVRLDSGDLAALARGVRRILDDARLNQTQIFASGDLDEHRIAALLAGGAPIDAFGVGTQLGTSGDAPWLPVVYKLVEDPSGPKIKLSSGKVTLPGRKQVFRVTGGGAEPHDVIGLAEEEPPPGGRPLLERVMAGGRTIRSPTPLAELRQRRAVAVADLPPRLRILTPGEHPYEVRNSARLAALLERLRHDLSGMR